MPINTRELLNAVSILTDERNMRVTLKESVKAGCITGASTIVGGILMGPPGIAIVMSDDIGDGWSMQGSREQVGGGYLVKKTSSPLDSELNLVNMEEPLQEDPGTSPHDNTSIHLTWEYDILYNVSYAVPVLYFNAWKPSGALLTLDEMSRQVPDIFQGRLHQNRWNFLTQQEHPILRRPYFYLHPCQTACILEAMPTQNPVVTWLSSVGPAVGLTLNPKYASITIQHHFSLNTSDKGSKKQGIGGILGACSAAYMSRGKFKPVSHVILYDLSLRQQEQLAVSLQRVVSDFRVDDVAILLPLLLTNSSCQAAILKQVVLFLQSEMNMQIID
uniref:Ubiquitin-like-conjugating enzyme ATG10 n=1 Tax=Timema genevievae TaxID=629358 RepID=A0A7R9PRK3_TIMGE|nr:unnamed protein product [Timema genevievae]